jgi:periplasmic divalent cation tolerance protein
MTNACLVLTTCGSDATARTMARDLVDRALAVSVCLQPAHTFFRFEGQCREEDEIRLLAVTTVDLYPEVERRLLELHTFEIPDIIMIRADAGAEATLAWIHSSCRA